MTNETEPADGNETEPLNPDEHLEIAQRYERYDSRIKTVGWGAALLTAAVGLGTLGYSAEVASQNPYSEGAGISREIRDDNTLLVKLRELKSNRLKNDITENEKDASDSSSERRRKTSFQDLPEDIQRQVQLSKDSLDTAIGQMEIHIEGLKERVEYKDFCSWNEENVLPIGVRSGIELITGLGIWLLTQGIRMATSINGQGKSQRAYARFVSQCETRYK